jgi:hypothetical protein
VRAKSGGLRQDVHVLTQDSYPHVENRRFAGSALAGRVSSEASYLDASRSSGQEEDRRADPAAPGVTLLTCRVTVGVTLCQETGPRKVLDDGPAGPSDQQARLRSPAALTCGD